MCIHIQFIYDIKKKAYRKADMAAKDQLLNEHPIATLRKYTDTA
jgi:hypothetical protein